MAATYQLWSATLTPIAVPLLVAAAAALYGRHVWVEPGRLLLRIGQVQLAPLVLGMLIRHFAPQLAERLRFVLNRAGNVLLIGVLAVVLWKLGPELLAMPWRVYAAVAGLAIVCASAIYLLVPASPHSQATLATANADRHIGLAILISGLYFHLEKSLPVIASYAVMSALLGITVTWLARRMKYLENSAA